MGSLGVLGIAAAVAGMGTFGTFTDTTTPVEADVDTGVLSVSLGRAANNATVPLIPGGLVPGDTLATPFDLRNDGTLAWSSVSFESAASRSSLLDTDRVNGLQMVVQSCSSPWTVTGPGAYGCGGTVTDFYTGPVVMDEVLEGAASLAPGRVDHLLATIVFPQSAGNALQGQVTDLAITFTAVQRDGTDR
nr:TasA family protein [Blastococcus saxobsidens]